jgi:hypothetical protein
VEDLKQNVAKELTMLRKRERHVIGRPKGDEAKFCHSSHQSKESIELDTVI